MLISRVSLEPAVLGELQSARYNLEITKKIDMDEYIKALGFGFFSLYYPIRKKEIALQLKYEFKSIENYLPDWWKYYWGFIKEYDLGEYDTGDPIELATKILIGWTMSWKYIQDIARPPRGVRIWTEDDFENIFYISKRIIMDGLEDGADGAVKTAAVWYSLVRWSGYNFDTDDVREMILENIKGDDYWARFVVLGKNEYMKRVISDYTSWLPWPEHFTRG